MQSARKIRQLMMDIVSHVQAIFTNACQKGIRLKTVSMDLFTAVHPEHQTDLEHFHRIGIPWEHFEEISELSTLQVDMTQRPAVEVKRPDDMHEIVRRVKQELVKLASELSLNEDKASYVSRDVFVTLHPELKLGVYKLEKLGVPWTHLLALAGIDSRGFFSKDMKKMAIIQFNYVAEHFGITQDYYSLLQKLLVHHLEEYPEGIDKFIVDTFGPQEDAKKKCSEILQNSSNLVLYLKSVD